MFKSKVKYIPQDLVKDLDLQHQMIMQKILGYIAKKILEIT